MKKIEFLDLVNPLVTLGSLKKISKELYYMMLIMVNLSFKFIIFILIVKNSIENSLIYERRKIGYMFTMIYCFNMNGEFDSPKSMASFDVLCNCMSPYSLTARFIGVETKPNFFAS